MGLTSFQVCMDSAHWLEGSHHGDSGMDSSSPSGDMLACSRPLMERRLRPQHDQPLKCPRCESTHTKFCYYNNYSLSQPRYFCKTCRRYWTKGGTLRNIPVGGGCRKNKKASSSKKPSENQTGPVLIQNQLGSASSSSLSRNPTDLHLSFPHEMQLSSHFGHLLGPGPFPAGMNHFPEGKSSPIDFMESKNNNYDFMGNNGSTNHPSEQVQLGLLSGGIGNFGDHLISGNINGFEPGNNFHGLCSPYGIISPSMDVHNGNNIGANLLDNNYNSVIDVKPNPRLLSLEWQDQNCSDIHAGKNVNVNAAAVFGSYGYNGLGPSWNGMINEYNTSTTNPLV